MMFTVHHHPQQHLYRGQSSDASPGTGNQLDYDIVTEHDRLVAEVPLVQNLPIAERLLLARRRRVEQTARYERWSRRQHSTHHQRTARRRVRVQFSCPVAVIEAVRRRDFNEVRSILSSSPAGSVDLGITDGLTALHMACIDGFLDVVKILVVEFSADVNCRDVERWTPLHVVALCGQSEIANYLIKHGADVLALNVDGNMPYDLCDDELTLDTIESAMAKQGVTQELINRRRVKDETLMLRDLQRLSKEGRDLEFRGQHGETPLHVAACNGYIQISEFLLSRLVDVNAVDSDFWTPLHHAAHWKQTAILEQLIRHGADIDMESNEGKTALDVCNDDELRHWLLKLATYYINNPSASHASHSHQSYPVFNVATHVTSPRSETSYTAMYSSNMSITDKSTLSSSQKRLDAAASATSRRKDAQDESTLWTSMQSLVLDDDEDDDDKSRKPNYHHQHHHHHHHATAPAEFRRPTPPSIDAQLELIVEDLKHDVERNQKRVQPPKIQTQPASESKTRANWKLKSSGNDDDDRPADKTSPPQNGQITKTRNTEPRIDDRHDDRHVPGRGQTSADLKKRRAALRQNNSTSNGDVMRMTSSTNETGTSTSGHSKLTRSTLMTSSSTKHNYVQKSTALSAKQKQHTCCVLM